MHAHIHVIWYKCPLIDLTFDLLSQKQQEEDPSAKDHLSGKMSSDVVPGSKNKGGKS